MKILRTFPALLLLAACGGHPTKSEPAVDPGAGLPTPPQVSTEVHGSAALHWHGAPGSPADPINLRGTFVSAMVPNTNGELTTVNGTTDADGGFVIDTAIDGQYWLRLFDVASRQDQYLLTDKTDLSLDIDAPGRPDGVAGSAGTLLFLNQLTGLEPYSSDDGFTWVSASLGQVLPLPIFPSAGDVSFNGSLDWSHWGLRTTADDARIVQLHHETDSASGLGYVGVAKSVQLPPFNMTNGEITMVAAQLTTPPTLSYTMAFKRSAWAPLQAQVHPTLAQPPSGERFQLLAAPGGLDVGNLYAIPALVMMPDNAALGVELTDLSVPLSLNNPYPDDWLFTTYSMEFPIAFPPPGDSTAFGPVAFASIGVETNVAPTASAPAVPLVSPARALKLNGNDAFVAQSNVGTHPTLSWTAPELGTATSYVITVYAWEGIDAYSPALGVRAIITVPGTTTSIELPPTILGATDKAVINVRALSQQGQDVATHGPFRKGTPYGWADTFTSTFEP